MIIALLRSGQSVRFVARGQSMWPAIPSRSQVEVVPCLASELTVGQIAAFERGGQVVVHRVQRVTPEGVYFAGDALRRQDGCIAAAQLLGRARVVERRALRWRRPRLEHLRRALRAGWRRLGPWLRNR
jgi:hypothetical protein